MSWTPLLIGLLVTAPLVAASYATSRLLALPFAPFGLFDWLTRHLPGAALAWGIDVLVRVIRGIGLRDTAAAAKVAEQAIAIVLFVTIGTLVATILYSVAGGRRHAVGIGIGIGAVLGLPMVLAIRSTEGASSSLPGGLWILASFAIWGAVVAWTSSRVPRPQPTTVMTHEARVAERLDRRRFLVRVGTASAVITVGGAIVGALGGRGRERERGARWSAQHPLPNSAATVVPVPGTRPEFTPLENHYRIDINTVAPVIDEDQWQLQVTGLVERPLALTMSDVRGHVSMDQFITLSCVSNPVAGDLIGTTRWTGVSLQRLVPAFGLKPQATHLRFRSADGFFETVPLDTVRSDPRVMLAYAWDGVPLPTKHGFPLRIHIPDVYGMKQPKWIVSIEALDQHEDGFWVVRGWDRLARMKATSVIDTVAVEAITTDAHGQTLVPMGGIAHAGARRISRVEVRLDNGPWSAAQLRQPLSDLTWVLWRYDMPFQPGEHALTVRCYDGEGMPQITEVAAPHPSGASGLHNRRVALSRRV